MFDQIRNKVYLKWKNTKKLVIKFFIWKPDAAWVIVTLHLNVINEWVIFYTCEANWRLMVYIIIHVSMFLFSRYPTITISCSVLRKSQQDQFLSISIVFESNPQLLATWIRTKERVSKFQPTCTRWILLKFRSQSQF